MKTIEIILIKSSRKTTIESSRWTKHTKHSKLLLHGNMTTDLEFNQIDIYVRVGKKIVATNNPVLGIPMIPYQMLIEICKGLIDVTERVHYKKGKFYLTLTN